MTGPIPVTVGRLQPFGNCPQSDDCHEDSGPTINKARIITRHVGRRHPTTNQSNIKMLELMMMVIIVPIIIIIIIGMSIPNTQSRPKNAGAHHSTGGKGGTTPTRPTPGKQPTTTPHHRGGGGGEEPLGGEGGGGRPNRDHTWPPQFATVMWFSKDLWFHLGVAPPVALVVVLIGKREDVLVVKILVLGDQWVVL